MSNHLIIILDPLHIFLIEHMASYMVAVVKQQLGKSSPNDQLTLPFQLLSIDFHSIYSYQLIRSLFSEKKCYICVCTE